MLGKVSLEAHLTLFVMCFVMAFGGWIVFVLAGSPVAGEMNPAITTVIIFGIVEGMTVLIEALMWAVRLFGPHNPPQRGKAP